MLIAVLFCEEVSYSFDAIELIVIRPLNERGYLSIDGSIC